MSKEFKFYRVAIGAYTRDIQASGPCKAAELVVESAAGEVSFELTQRVKVMCESGLVFTFIIERI